MVLDIVMALTPIIIAILWLWPERSHGDPYDDKDNWGQQ